MDRELAIKRISGCFLAVPTLFNEDYSLNLGGMEQIIHFLVGNGLREGNATILVNGATGQFPLLSPDERKKTAETVVRAAAGRIGVIVGAQSCAAFESAEIARHAQDIGAAAIQVSPPFYFPPTDDDVYEHVAAIAKAAPDMGIVFYNTWWLNYGISLGMLARLSGIPQVVGVKWSSPNETEYQLAYLRFGRQLAVIDNKLLPVMSKLLGGAGANLHPAMFWPEWGARLWALLEAGEWSQAQEQVNRLLLPFYEVYGEAVRVCGGEGHVDKLALEAVGLPGGPSRPPMRPLPPVFRERIQRVLVEAGVPLSRG